MNQSTNPVGPVGPVHLVLRGNYAVSTDNVLIQVLATLCRTLQHEYDLSPQILDQIFNDPEFVDIGHFLHQQCMGEMTLHLHDLKQQPTEVTPEEMEKCGHLIATHPNGYISYCNVHRYLHPHKDIPLVHPHQVSDTPVTPNVYEYEMDHLFVTKSHDKILKERYYMAIHSIYQSFVNKLYHMIHQVVVERLQHSCRMSVVQVTDQTSVSDIHLQQIVEMMKSDPLVFKSRLIYEPMEDHRHSDTPNLYLKLYHWEKK